MPINKVEKTTIQGVLHWYELHNICNWTILQKKDYVKYYYNGNDTDEALNYLNDCLNDLKGDDNVNNCLDYILRLDTPGVKGKKVENLYLMFNLTGEHKQVMPQGIYYPGNNLSKNDIIQILDEYHSKKELEEIEDEIDEAEPKSAIAGFFESMLANPNVQAGVINFFMNAAGTMAGTRQAQQPVTSLAGIDNINDILKKLYSKGVTNDDLSLLADKDQATITMLLNMLRGGQ